ncbi:MAG: 4-hydroxyphenylpyruvate dioxygenase [Paracidovorax wautersii]|uniref:4-hydroxyphenylpyruvate dioxygenase n=1 Tax=Paracidovorax wautersii TaxID=1177982 RepID=A0A7V8FM26_9BURK|nr:MAG: 4-hydroxyphenylpyruvate dioxygenase [Paracidovorax wautersii]
MTLAAAGGRPPEHSRETIGDMPNPLGMDGIEFIEYATTQPQAFGHVLESLGFRAIARHRSREVILFRQGGMNIVVNAHTEDEGGRPAVPQAPRLSAIALRVRNAAYAYQYVQERGAWPVRSAVEVMELNIPAIHGVGDTRLYFVDRYRDFSIYDVDFVPIPAIDSRPPTLGGLHFFGVVQYVGMGRGDDWLAFYADLLGMRLLPSDARLGILPQGDVLQSACGQFFLQLVEPEPDAIDVDSQESLHRLAFGTPDVLETARVLSQRGVHFVESPILHVEPRGALTQPLAGGVTFELVCHRD